MVLSKLNKPIMWSITICSKRHLSNSDRDFVAELVSEEARKVCSKPYYFILHDVIESQNYLIAFVEASKTALNNLLWVIRDNLPYEVNYKKCG
jgi:hypothetical protein